MRRVPAAFFTQKRKEFIKDKWPYALGVVCCALYLVDNEPFDEIGGAVVAKMRRPLMRGTEWLEVRDADPETLALELPPDQIFGPLDFKSQMKFVIAAIKAENELADSYITRLLIDYMDLSLDQPVLSEAEILANGGLELLDLAIKDFLELRPHQKHKFFFPDSFIRYVNWIAAYPTLSAKFVNEYDGVRLLLESLKLSKEAYSRILVMRSLTLFCFTQKDDGGVERRILQCDGMKQILDLYKDHTGDPLDSKFITLPLSSILRHYPNEGTQEFLAADGMGAIVSGLNVAKFKGIPQHVRLIRDIQNLKSKTPGEPTWQKMLYDADFLPVAMGILDVFPEYFEVVTDLADLLVAIQAYTTPLEMLEYRAFRAFSAVFGRYMNDSSVLNARPFEQLSEIATKILNDEDCQRCLDPSVCPYELQQHATNVRNMIKSCEAARAAAAASDNAAVAVAA